MKTNKFEKEIAILDTLLTRDYINVQKTFIVGKKKTGTAALDSLVLTAEKRGAASFAQYIATKAKEQSKNVVIKQGTIAAKTTTKTTKKTVVKGKKK